ncbi:hypothetical protein RRF57_009339 [Xylaria bambusicola]|uniref:Uncharacterized protein n=1 Tax=Xylaria bambusicola TaxID=326684 RepID=A0AAN7UJG5_9PEZI
MYSEVLNISMGSTLAPSRSSFSLSAFLASCSSLAFAFAAPAGSRFERASISNLSRGRAKAACELLQSSRYIPSIQRCTSRSWSHKVRRSFGRTSRIARVLTSVRNRCSTWSYGFEASAIGMDVAVVIPSANLAIDV